MATIPSFNETNQSITEKRATRKNPMNERKLEEGEEGEEEEEEGEEEEEEEDTLLQLPC